MFYDMLIFDNLTIIICSVILVLAILSCFLDSFFKKLWGNEYKEDDLPPVSIIIISDNNATELQKNLPAYLSQDYPKGFEVIVVVCNDEDNTEKMLESFSENEKLHITFVPNTARYMSKRKLAITLGAKAAKNEWILLTDAVCRPDTDKWVETMASNCTSDRLMVFGYSNYSAKTGKFKRFFRLHNEYRNMLEASKSAGYGMTGNNLMFRKSVFMENKGFQGNLKFTRGEYDFLINKYGEEDAIAVEMSPDSFLEESKPTRKAWQKKNLFYMETRKHLKHRLRHRFIFNIDMLSLHLCMWLSIAAITFGSLTSRWLIVIIAALALIVPFIVRMANANRVFRCFDANIPLICVIPFEIHIVFHNFKSKIKYKSADKTEFISHKF